MRIYEAAPGALIATGDRSVTTFPSGLVRVDQSYACTTSAAAGHRAGVLRPGNPIPSGDSYPALDGLYIYPEPGEKRRPDGFTEFAVSCYGRTSATMGELQQDELQSPTYTGAWLYLVSPYALTSGTTKPYSFTPSPVLRPLAWPPMSYNAWQVSGSMVIRTGEVVTSQSAGFPAAALAPFNVTSHQAHVLTMTNNPAGSDVESTVGEEGWHSVKVTERFLSDRDKSLLVQPSDVPYDVFIKSRIRVYDLIMENASGAQRADKITLIDPGLKITGHRAFGVFTEITLSTNRFGMVPVEI